MKNMIVKTIKYSTALLIVVFLLLLIAPFFINANDYKQIILDQAESATGRKIAIDDMRASLFPWLGVTLTGVHIANRDEFASDKEFMNIAKLDVQVELIPLLHRQISIKRFILNTPKITLERLKNGKTSWGDLTTERAAATTERTHANPTSANRNTAPTKAMPLLAAFSAHTLQVHGGVLRYKDGISQRVITLSKLQLNINDVQREHPVKINATAELNGFALKIDGHVGPVSDLAIVDVTRLPAQLHLTADIPLNLISAYAPMLTQADTLGLDIHIEQRPDGLRVSEGMLSLHDAHRIDIHWNIEMPTLNKLHIRDMRVNLDDQEVIHTSGNIQGLDSKMHYQLRLDTSDMTRTTLASWWPPLKAMYANHPQPWKKFKLGMLAEGDTQAIKLSDIRILLDEELLQASADIKLNAAPNIRFRVTANKLDIDPWLPAGTQQQNPTPSVAAATDSGMTKTKTHTSVSDANKSVTPSSSPPAETAQEPDLRFLTPWRVNGEFEIGTLLLRGLQMQHLRATLKGSNGVFTLNPMRFALAGGQVEEHASLTVKTWPASWKESVHITNMQLQPVLQALTGKDTLSGTMNMDTKWAGNSLLPHTALRTFSGYGEIRVRDGKIKGVDIPGTIRRITSPAPQGSQSTDFSQLSATFKAQKGRVRNDDLFMSSPLFRLTGYGQINLIDMTMDYHLKPRLVGTLIGQGDSQQARKGLVVPLHITGSVSNPKVKVELNAKNIVENIGAIRNLLKKGKQSQKKENAPKNIEKQLQQLLPGLKF